uniref:Short-chain dehydrogenase/reductase 3 n=2 Tax=Clytia hemisphaerica TaxID=252671 RepID=A0A7M5XFK1_9CNID|eukprot:TCONS_00004865-protein
MVSAGELFQKACNLIYLLFQMAIIWPWSMIKYFLPKNKKDISGEILFMSGAGSGIGRLMSIKFAELGAIVICTDLNAETAEQTANTIKSNGGKAYSYQLDVTDRLKVYALAEQIKREVGDVTMLINNAGIVTGKKILDAPDQLMVKTMEVNTISHFWTLKAFLPSMLEKNHGHIVTVSSIAGHSGAPAMVDYCASKFGAVGIHESLTVELIGIPDNKIQTSCVCPFFIKTGMFDGVSSGSPILLPLLEVDFTVESIVCGVLNDEETIYVPRMLLPLMILKNLAPSALMKPLSDYLKLHTQMNDFKGRKEGKKAK